MFTAIALFTGGAVVIGLASEKAPPAPVVSRLVQAGPDDRVSVQLVGDTMLGGEFVRLFAQRGPFYDWPFDALRPVLTAADYVVAVAEAPITPRVIAPSAPPREFFFTSKPPVAAALAAAGVDALVLASDGISDSGPAALVDTLREAEKAGLATVGAGPNRARAEQPLVLRTEIGTIGIVSVGEGFTHQARDDRPGTMTLSAESVQRGADLARAAGADWVIAVVHWGDSYTSIQPRQRYAARLFADAGYDLVVGSGPHVIQPIELIGSMPVIYSVGNFVYGSQGRFEELGLPGYGLTVGLELRSHHAPRLTVRCAMVDNRVVNFQPRPCNPVEAQTLLPGLTTDLNLEGDVAVLRCATCFPALGRQ